MIDIEIPTNSYATALTMVVNSYIVQTPESDVNFFTEIIHIFDLNVFMPQPQTLLDCST